MERVKLNKKRRKNKFNHFEWREFANTGLMYQYYFDAEHFRLSIRTRTKDLELTQK